MNTRSGHIFASLPTELAQEQFDELLSRNALRIERIVSQGHCSPAQGWYDQAQHEWVMVLRGAARVDFDSGEQFELGPGDYLDIPAHRRHRVSWTDPQEKTVWLALHYPAD